MNVKIDPSSDHTDMYVSSASYPKNQIKISTLDDDILSNAGSIDKRDTTTRDHDGSLANTGIDLLIRDDHRHKSQPRSPTHNEDDRGPTRRDDLIGNGHDNSRNEDHSGPQDPHSDLPAQRSRNEHASSPPFDKSRPPSPTGSMGSQWRVPSSRHDDRHHETHDDFPFQNFGGRNFDTLSVRSGASERETVKKGLSKSEEDRQKRDLLRLFERLAGRGAYIPKTFSMEDDLNDMREEYTKIKSLHDAEAAIQFYRSALNMFANGICFANTRLNPYPLALQGLQEAFSNDMEKYDDVFEELHLKYASKISLPPEIRLLWLVSSTVVVTHFTNKLMDQDPDVGDILREEPELMKQFQAAALRRASRKNPDLGGLFGAMGSSISRPSSARRSQPPWPSSGNNLPSGIPRAAYPNGFNRDDDAKSVNLSDVGDNDRVSDVSSMAESEFLHGRSTRPRMGMRATTRNGILHGLNERRPSAKQSKNGIVIDV